MDSQTQQYIRALEEKIYCLETIIQNVHEGVILTDRNCKITVFNPAKARMEHMDADKVLGEISWLAYERSDWETSEHRRVQDSGEAILDAYRPHAFVGEAPVYINYETVPIKKDGEVIGVYSICRTESILREMLYKLLEHKRQLHSEIQKSTDPVKLAEGTRYTFADIMGTSPIMSEMLREAQTIATMNMSVLITGETGVGKEVLAQSIHNLGREGKKFIAINCAAIPAELFESTLFGTVKGAYTGAVNSIGLFREAGEGTLFLDEFNSLTPLNQTKLLRVLQERCVRPVGSTKEYPIKCRLICASNENLQLLLREGRLRADLYYRISEFCLEIPPLRERPEDILSLSQMFVEQYNRELDRNIHSISDDLKLWLRRKAWYGNTRELQHMIQNIMLKADKFSDTLTLANLPIVTRSSPDWNPDRPLSCHSAYANDAPPDNGDGADGVDNTDGTDGADGTDGGNGTNDTDGADGTDGGNGTDDTDGADGTDGGNGTNGTDPGNSRNAGSANNFHGTESYPSDDSSTAFPDRLKQFQKFLLEQELAKQNFNISATARSLQISRQNLLGRMNRLGIKRPGY